MAGQFSVQDPLAVRTRAARPRLARARRTQVAHGSAHLEARPPERPAGGVSSRGALVAGEDPLHLGGLQQPSRRPLEIGPPRLQDIPVGQWPMFVYVIYALQPKRRTVYGFSRRQAASPQTPAPSRSSVAGSGTSGGVGVSGRR